MPALTWRDGDEHKGELLFLSRGKWGWDAYCKAWMRLGSLFTNLVAGAGSVSLEIARFQLFPVALRAGCRHQHLLLCSPASGRAEASPHRVLTVFVPGFACGSAARAWHELWVNRRGRLRAGWAGGKPPGVR